jgi:hypothetical protein
LTYLERKKSYGSNKLRCEEAEEAEEAEEKIPNRVKPKTIKLVFVASPLSRQQSEKCERAKTGWLEIRIICPNGATCPPADCSFGVPTL